jgi:hypothetical protein
MKEETTQGNPSAGEERTVVRVQAVKAQGTVGVQSTHS